MEDFFGDWFSFIDKNLLLSILDVISGDAERLCPKPDNVFRAFAKCSYHNLKLVVIGQDPYPNNMATGLAFGNPEGTIESMYSPSLKVLKRSIDAHYDDLPSGENVFPTLESLAEQGVLLLNSSLTTKNGCIGSHLELWKPFVSSFLYNLTNHTDDIIFLLLGNQARECKKFISSKYIIEENHPSWYARTGNAFPDVWSVIDKMCIESGKELIFWK